ncbi:hypothetical protein ACFVS2_25350 [Brevibacillus sp. NPDC058079]|uniref:hypothetical protein n=1 Tax=Brevibacillus sp. NPDC058079 TaxID=3346330 RepID=UPI0036E4B4F5
MGYSIFTKKASAINKENLAEAIQMVKGNLEANKKGYKVYNILNFGRVIEGYAYYHEVDQYYYCVGVEIEVESQFVFKYGGSPEKESELTKEVGFYSIWRGKASPHAPITFEMGCASLGEGHKFDNGCGDEITVTKTIFTMEEVQEVVSQLGLLTNSK